MKASDSQVGGNHYVKLSVQPWEAMESWMGRERFKGFILGNVIKYLARYPRKNGLQDLEKAQHYLAKLIELESDNNNQT